MTATPDTGKEKLSPLQGKRVLLLLHHMVIVGGAMHYTLRLAGQLREQGASVALLVLRADRKSSVVPDGVELLSLNGPLTSSLWYWLFFPFWQARISRAITAWRPDLLVPQAFPANWWGWLYKRSRPGTSLVWICHEPSAFIHSQAWIRALRPWWKSMLARILSPLLAAVDVPLARYSDRIVVNSRFTELELRRVYGIKADGIAYPGIDFADSDAGELRRERSIITVGRLTKFKRVDFLLEVFRELLKVYPDLTYHIVGAGEEEDALPQLAKRLGVEARVVFHGAVDDLELAALYRRSCLFLHGSVAEPFGMAPLEAIACGTPVVAHRSGGPVEFVTDDCGRLIDSLTVADWAGEIIGYLNFLFTHDDFPERVRECARGFDWRLSLKPAIEVIAGLCAGDGNNR